MIYGLLHPGSGLGNNLFRYVAVRSRAEELGVDFGMIGDFKGKSFIELDKGNQVDLPYIVEKPSGKIIVQSSLPLWEEKTYYYNPDYNFIPDNTIVDGNFESEHYFNLGQVKEWLKTEPLDIPDDVCIIGFRGGEYYTVPELGLPLEYYERAINEMKQINPVFTFEVHTDDIEMAKQFFPEYRIVQSIGENWRAMRYAKYAIIANSSFYVLPRLLSGGITIAPRYWNRYNTKKWDYPQGYYKSFKYI